MIKLLSDRNVDYTRLRDLLATGNWKEADQETLRVMLKAANREQEGSLDTESIDNFPCTDLRTIDQLWVKYSNGKFGFSVQKQIYQSSGGTKKCNKQIWEDFGDRVGWRHGGKWLHYSELTFNLDTPYVGHLPTWEEFWGMGVVWCEDCWDSFLAQRLVDCGL